MIRRSARLGALLLAAALIGAAPWEARSGAGAAGTPVELRGNLGRLRQHFNAHRDLPRAVLLLSPT